MAGRLPPTDASEARVLGITNQAYLDSLDGKAITKGAWLTILPKQGPARKAQTPARMKAIDFEEAPEPTSADRLAIMQANLKSHSIEVPESTEVVDARNYPEMEVKVGPTTQELLDSLDEEDAQPTEAMVDEFTRQCGA